MSGGIVAAISLTNEPIDPASFEHMASRLAHRAMVPTGVAQVVSDGWLSVGHLGGEVFSYRDERTVCVVHGRIDNLDEFDSGVRGAGADPASVIAHLISAGGADALGRVLGDFAVLWCDRGRRSVVASRDARGMKPLVMRQVDSTLYLAPECGALVDLGTQPELDKGHLAEFLSGMARCRTSTPWSGVERIEPGVAIAVDRGRVREMRWWFPEAMIEHRGQRADAAALETILRCSVHDRLGIGENVIELSGGMDSSTVLALAAETDHLLLATTRDHGRSTSRDVDLASDVAAEFNVPHTLSSPVGSTANEAVDWLQRLAWSTADLTVDPFVAWQWHVDLAEMKRRETAVALSGQGGDERLGPAHRWAIDLLRRNPRASLAFSRTALGANYGGRALARRMARFGFEAIRPPGWRRPGGSSTPHTDAMTWLAPGLAAETALEDRIRPATVGRRASHAKTQLLDWAVTENSNGFFDAAERAAATAGVSYRHPFEDRRLVEWSLAVDESERVDPNDGRAAHRKVVSKLITSAVGNRQDKADFTAAIARLQADAVWGSGTTMLGRSSSVPAVVEAELIDQAWLNAMLKRLAADDPNVGPSLQLVSVVEIWLARAPY